MPGQPPGTVITWWTISPALLILIVPLGFRLTCYYYRRAYYRGFWRSPPACAVADAHGTYSGETRFPLILQNVHRWFFYLGLVFNIILTIDAVVAFRLPGTGHRGERRDAGPVRQRRPAVALQPVVPLVPAPLRRPGQRASPSTRSATGSGSSSPPSTPGTCSFAWASLIFVALTDLYVRLVASGAFPDPKLF